VRSLPNWSPPQGVPAQALTRHAHWSTLGQERACKPRCTPGKYLEAEELESALTSTRVQQVMAASTIGLRACYDCIDEDLRAHGFSYWRRSHHVPGRYICARHGLALHLLGNCGGITALPDAVISCGAHASESLLRLTRQSPAICRYLDHLDHVVSGRLVIESGNGTAPIRRALLQQGELLYSRGWASRFAARIARAFSYEWLQRAVSPSCQSTDAIVINFVRGLFYDYFQISHPAFAVLASMAVESVHQDDRQVLVGEHLCVDASLVRHQ
jgi:hypothetical protein